ncbi:MAG: nuclear transport factor 2 family protein [Blastocatellia bacterium]
MKYLSTLIAMFLALPFAAFAQDSKGDQEVRDFIAEYERAVASRDLAFLERVMPDDYVYSGPSGKMTTRAQALTYFREQREKPAYKSHSLEHLNVKVHVVNNMALVTNDWISVISANDSTNTAPTTYVGRHTGVFEKRNGCWMVIAEHDSEKPYDDKWMVEGLAKAGREYNELTRRLRSGRSYAELESAGDIASLNRTLAEEYTYTSRDGTISSKAQVVESYKTHQIIIESAEVLEHNARTIENGAAVETGKIRYVGTSAGRPFDITERYTTTWAFYDGRWQITANHASAVKQ